MIDFRKITYFLKTAEKLNFTEAARELFISPQALTQQIAQLERELGTPLFARTTRRVALTEAGQFCYQKFAPVLDSYLLAEQEVTRQLSHQSSLLRAGFFHGLPKQKIVNPWLDLIQTYFPQAELEILSTDLGSIWRYMDEGRLDLCLTNVDDSFPLQGYHAVRLLTAPAEILVSQSHPWARKNAITCPDMAAADMVQLRTSYSSGKEENFYGHVRCRSVRQVADFDTLLATLENGRTFAVCPPTFEYHDRSGYRFFPLPEEYRFSFSTVCAARHHPVFDLEELLTGLKAHYQ